MAINLTEGSISMLTTGEGYTVDLKPVLQVIDVRIVQTLTPTGGSGENKEMYTVLLSDGSFHKKAMLATKRNELVTSQQLQKGSIVQLTEFVCKTILDHRFIVIINVNVILDKCDTIGDPKPFPGTYIWKTISQIKDENLGTSEKPDYITVKATLWHMKTENFCYKACPIMIGDKKCSKKVVNNGDGTWLCKKCDQVVDECDYRYNLQLQIQDHTGSTWISAFQETGEEIMGVSAKDLYVMKYEDEDEEGFTEIVRGVLFDEFVFKLRVKEEFLFDEVRVRSRVVKAEKMKFLSNMGTRILEVSSVSES